MNKKGFNIVGLILLSVIGISWIINGYFNWYLTALLLAYISFSIGDGRIKQVRKMKRISMKQILLVLFALGVSACIVFSLIQLANDLSTEKS